MKIRGAKSAMPRKGKPPTGIFSNSGAGQKHDRAPKQTPAVKAAFKEAYSHHNLKPTKG